MHFIALHIHSYLLSKRLIYLAAVTLDSFSLKLFQMTRLVSTVLYLILSNAYCFCRGSSVAKELSGWFNLLPCSKIIEIMVEEISGVGGIFTRIFTQSDLWNILNSLLYLINTLTTFLVGLSSHSSPS